MSERIRELEDKVRLLRVELEEIKLDVRAAEYYIEHDEWPVWYKFRRELLLKSVPERLEPKLLFRWSVNP